MSLRAAGEAVSTAVREIASAYGLAMTFLQSPISNLLFHSYAVRPEHAPQRVQPALLLRQLKPYSRLMAATRL